MEDGSTGPSFKHCGNRPVDEGWPVGKAWPVDEGWPVLAGEVLCMTDVGVEDGRCERTGRLFRLIGVRAILRVHGDDEGYYEQKPDYEVYLRDAANDVFVVVGTNWYGSWRTSSGYRGARMGDLIGPRRLTGDVGSLHFVPKPMEQDLLYRVIKAYGSSFVQTADQTPSDCAAHNLMISTGDGGTFNPNGSTELCEEMVQVTPCKPEKRLVFVMDAPSKSMHTDLHEWYMWLNWQPFRVEDPDAEQEQLALEEPLAVSVVRPQLRPLRNRNRNRHSQTEAGTDEWPPLVQNTAVGQPVKERKVPLSPIPSMGVQWFKQEAWIMMDANIRRSAVRLLETADEKDPRIIVHASLSSHTVSRRRRRRTLYVLVGPSGVGKSFLASKVHPHWLRWVYETDQSRRIPFAMIANRMDVVVVGNKHRFHSAWFRLLCAHPTLARYVLAPKGGHVRVVKVAMWSKDQIAGRVQVAPTLIDRENALRLRLPPPADQNGFTVNVVYLACKTTALFASTSL